MSYNFGPRVKKHCSGVVRSIESKMEPEVAETPEVPEGEWITKDFVINHSLNAYVLANIFDHLDVPNLKNCRFVARLWDEEALLKLSKKIFIQIQGPSSPDSTENLKRTLSLDATLRKKTQISRVKTPLFFQTIKTHAGFTLKSATLSYLFQDFGMNLKSLSVFQTSRFSPIKSLTSWERQQFLHQVLTSWCPNLVNLELEIEKEEDYENLEIIEISQSLKLQKVTIIESHEFSSSSTRNFVVSVLKKSPFLKTLEIIMKTPDNVEPKIYNNLLEISSLGEKLEELHCDLPKRQHPLTESSFEKFLTTLKNLKKLSFDGRGKPLFYYTTKQLPNNYVCQELKNNLTHLELCDVFWWNGVRSSKQKGVISQFVQSFPNLTCLKINLSAYINFYTVNEMFISIGISEVVKTPLLHLKKLTLIDCFKELNNLTAAEGYANAFPNLEYLEVKISTNWDRSLSDEFYCDLTLMFSGLIGLSNLRVLKVAKCVEFISDVTSALFEVSNFPRLECLSLYVWQVDTRRSKNFFWGPCKLTLGMLMKPLISIRNLQSIALKKCMVRRLDIDDLNAFAAGNNIRLKLTEF